MIQKTVRAGCVALALVSILSPVVARAQVMTFTHVAGGTEYGWFDGIGVEARFQYPSGIAADGAGNLYLTDTGNHTIRKFVVATGQVSTLAGLAGVSGSTDGTGSVARFYWPYAIAADGAGNLYVADSGNDTIRKIVIASGAVTTLAGKPGAFGSVDGTGDAARLDNPRGIAADGAGNLYVAEMNSCTIRKIVAATGVVTTLAGSPGVGGSTDGPGYVARFRNPAGVALDGQGNLLIADTYNHTIRRLALSTGLVTTLAGTPDYYGSTDGTGSAARFNMPDGLAVDAGGNLYVADSFNNSIRKVSIASAAVTTLAGAPYRGSADAIGSAARFYHPHGLALDGSGNLFVTDLENSTVRRIVISTGAVSTAAGAAVRDGNENGIGSTARFSYPRGVAADGAGNIFVADTANDLIRRIDLATGAVTTLAGSNGSGTIDGIGTAAHFSEPTGLVSDGAGNLYVADSRNNSIRKIEIATAAVTTLAGQPASWGTNDGVGPAARFHDPEGITYDGAGNLYVADTANNTIRKIVIATSAVSTLAGTAEAPGSADGVGSAARFRYPRGLASDGAGNLYVADTWNDTIRKIVIATGAVTTIAGAAGISGYADGSGSAARFRRPHGIVVDGAGSLFVTDTDNHTIRRVDTASGAVTTVAGTVGETGSEDGTGSAARFSGPSGIARDGGGVLFVADTLLSGIRKGAPALADVATIDGATGVVGHQRQLDTAPQTAASWLWEQIRVEGTSGAALSSTSARNPTFTPDVPSVSVFRLTASGGGAASISTVTFAAHALPIATVRGGGTICAGQSATIEADLTGQQPWAVTWSDGSVQAGVTKSPATRVVSPGSTTTYTVTGLSDANANGSGVGSAVVTVSSGSAPSQPVISAEPFVDPASAGNLASVAAHVGSSYAWTATGATITAGQGTSEIAFTAGPPGTMTLSVAEIGPTGCSSPTASRTIMISASAQLSFFPVSPCRLFDTRKNTGPDAAWPPLTGEEIRLLSISGRCGLPSTARTLSVNATITEPGASGHLVLFPGDLASPPSSSSLAFAAGRTRASNAIVDLSSDGAQSIKVFHSAPADAHFILDVSGYFE